MYEKIPLIAALALFTGALYLLLPNAQADPTPEPEQVYWEIGIYDTYSWIEEQ